MKQIEVDIEPIEFDIEEWCYEEECECDDNDEYKSFLQELWEDAFETMENAMRL